MKTTKVILILALASLWMVGCHSHNHGTEHGDAVRQASGDLNLQLDNGKKWIANPETHVGFEQIKQRLELLDERESLTLSDYNTLGKDLQAEVDGIVDQCTMTGKGHEELHKLLIPVIQNIKTLQQADETACKKAVEELNHLTDIYFEYFRVE